jgi:hypothetical protein
MPRPAAREPEPERRRGAEHDRGDGPVDSRERVQHERPGDDDRVLQRIAQAPRRRALEPERELRQQRRRRPERDRREHERDLRRRHAPRRQQRGGQDRDGDRRDERRAHRAEAPGERARQLAPPRRRERPEHAREQRRPADPARRRDPGSDRQRDREAPEVGGPQRAWHEQHEPDERHRLERLAAGAAGEGPPRKRAHRAAERVLPAHGPSIRGGR